MIDEQKKQRPSNTAPDRGLKNRIRVGVLTVIVLITAVGGWAATAKLSGAIVATGHLVVEGNTKTVQHPTGGVVAEIRVSNGARVAAGDVLVRLDDTQTRANLGLVLAQLRELTGRKARMAALSTGEPEIRFPPGFADESTATRQIVSGERRLFIAERESLEGQVSQLRERIGQLQIEIEGLESQRRAKKHEFELVNDERRRYESLYQKRLTPITRVIEKKREQTRIDGEYGALTSTIARVHGQIAEIELQILGLAQTSRTQAQKELRDIEARIAELSERKVAAADRLKRIDIRAPRCGVVHDLTIHTLGGVIGAGKPIMRIVPVNDELTIEARISPTDIDQVRIDQPAMLRFSAFNQRTTPELPGAVTRIGADLTTQEQTGETFYRIRVKADEDALPAIADLKLVPGMPVEAFIQTGERTTLSYLLKPVTDHFARAWLEE